MHYNWDLVPMSKSTKPMEQYTFSSGDMRVNDIVCVPFLLKKYKKKWEPPLTFFVSLILLFLSWLKKVSGTILQS